MRKGTTSRKQLITCAQAAEELGFTPDYIRRLIMEKKIAAEKVGRDWLLTRKAIAGIKRQRAASVRENAHGSGA